MRTAPQQTDVAVEYDEIADTYDRAYSTVVDEAENFVVGDLLPRVKGSYLDMGCGTGLGLELLQNHFGFDYTGIDISKGMLEVARERHPSEGTFVVGNMMREYEPEHDVVMSLFGSPNYANFDNVCEVAYSALKPGGEAFLMPFTRNRILDRATPIPARSAARPVGRGDAVVAMAQAGFFAVRVRGLSCTHTDAIGNTLRLGTLRAVLTERLNVRASAAIFLIVTGQKPA